MNREVIVYIRFSTRPSTYWKKNSNPFVTMDNNSLRSKGLNNLSGKSMQQFLLTSECTCPWCDVNRGMKMPETQQKLRRAWMKNETRWPHVPHEHGQTEWYGLLNANRVTQCWGKVLLWIESRLKYWKQRIRIGRKEGSSRVCHGPVFIQHHH